MVYTVTQEDIEIIKAPPHQIQEAYNKAVKVLINLANFKIISITPVAKYDDKLDTMSIRYSSTYLVDS